MTSASRSWIPLGLIVAAAAAAALVSPSVPSPVLLPLDRVLPLEAATRVGPAPKPVVLYLMPTLALIVWALFQWFRTRAGERLARTMFSDASPAATSSPQFDRFGKAYDAIVLALTVLILGVHAGAVAAALGFVEIAARFVPAVAGTALVMMGNVFPRLRPNWVAGIRTKRTLADPALWRSTHRAFGTALVVAGLVTMTTGVVAPRYGLVVALGSLLVALVTGGVAAARSGGAAAVAATALLCALPAMADAQLPRAENAVETPAAVTTGTPRPLAHYVYLQGADTLAHETLTQSPTHLRGSLQMRGQPLIVWEQPLASGGRSGFSLKVFAPGAPAGARPMQVATFTMIGDSAYALITSGDNTEKRSIPATAGAYFLLSTSLAQSALIGGSVLAETKATYDVFLVSGGIIMSGEVRRAADTVVSRLAGVEMRARFDPDGLPREIGIPSQRLRVIRSSSGHGDAPPPSRYNYDAPADAPYVAEHVRIPTPRGYELAATLTRPKGAGRVAVAITISGSGPQERDSRISLVPGYAIFREIADTLGRRGVATLRFDDRGVGESGGLLASNAVTTADFADDVRSIVEWLRARPDIDGDGIVLVGHSEGGMIAPMVAAPDPRIRAIALLAGPAYDGRRILMHQNRESVEAMAGASRAVRDSIMQGVPAGIDSAAASMPWIEFFVNHDPLVTARKVMQPVLVVHGETDRQVTVEQADTLAAAITAAGNRAVTLRKFPRANHLFVEDPSGAVAGYGTLRSSHVRKDVLGTIADWVAVQVGKDR